MRPHESLNFFHYPGEGNFLVHFILQTVTSRFKLNLIPSRRERKKMYLRHENDRIPVGSYLNI